MSEAKSKEEDVNRASQSLKKGLHTVKVSQIDATRVQQEIEGEMFGKWHEGWEVMEAKGIEIKNMKDFLDHLQDAYEGIGEEARKKMDGSLYASDWEYKIVDFKYNPSSDSGARYGMIAFGKSKDGMFVDCMYCLYKLDFKVAPTKIIKKERSIFWGLVKWETVENRVQESDLGVKSLKRIQNFFRVKALEGFYKEGLIDQINVVPSIDDVVDSDN